VERRKFKKVWKGTGKITAAFKRVLEASNIDSISLDGKTTKISGIQ
jgi:hypothetical protein